MQHPFKKILALLIALFVVTSLFACGEEPEGSGDGSGDAISGDGDHQNGSGGDHGDGDGDDDQCDEGFELNPFTGQCVEIPEEDDLDADLDDPGAGDGGGSGGGGDGGNDGPVDCGFGTLVGQACATNGNPLPSAEVRLVGQDCDGVPFQRTASTDGSGLFTIDNIPAGHHELLVSSGSFSSERFIDISGGRTLNLATEASKVCVSGDVNILVIEGFWDNVPGLLDNLELDYTTMNNAADVSYLFSNPAELAEYDIIFIECAFSTSSLQGDLTLMMNNLRSWIEQGNSLYASDLAYRFIEQTFPNIVDFPGSGSGGQTVIADVVSTPMQTLLNSNTISIYFDTGWRRMDNVQPPTVVHFRANVNTGSGMLNDVPLMVSYTDPINGGTVLYMSFHNREASLGSDMVDVLNFTIFQL